MDSTQNSGLGGTNENIRKIQKYFSEFLFFENRKGPPLELLQIQWKKQLEFGGKINFPRFDFFLFSRFFGMQWVV